MSKPKLFHSDIKIIIIGSHNTGKTSFTNKWTKNVFESTYKPTIVSEFGFKLYEYDEKIYRIQVWDIAGQDNDPLITKTFIRDSHGCVICSDCTDSTSYDKIRQWKICLDETAMFPDQNPLPCVFIENKCDLLREEEAKNTMGMDRLCAELNFTGAFRTSCKDGVNIDSAMDCLLRNIMERFERLINDPNGSFSSVKRNNKKIKTIKELTKETKSGFLCC